MLCNFNEGSLRFKGSQTRDSDWWRGKEHTIDFKSLIV